MDTVRFGRALGLGARQAVKTLATAVDAATAANPSDKKAQRSESGGRASQTGTTAASASTSDPAEGHAVRPAANQAQARTAPPTVVRKAAHTAAQTVTQARGVREGIRRGSQRFREAAWGPFVRLSGVLWLEVAGVFFGIFALLAAEAVWRLRGEWHLAGTNAGGHRSLAGAVGMMAIFGYFCVTSFVRARRRERRR